MELDGRAIPEALKPERVLNGVPRRHLEQAADQALIEARRSLKRAALQGWYCKKS